MTLEPDRAADSRGATPPPPGKGGDDIVIVLATPEHAQPLQACLDSVSRERRFLIADEAPPVDAIRDNLKVQIDGGAFVDTWAMVLLLDGRTEVASPGAV